MRNKLLILSLILCSNSFSENYIYNESEKNNMIVNYRLCEIGREAVNFNCSNQITEIIEKKSYKKVDHSYFSKNTDKYKYVFIDSAEIENLFVNFKNEDSPYDHDRYQSNCKYMFSQGGISSTNGFIFLDDSIPGFITCSDKIFSKNTYENT